MIHYAHADANGVTLKDENGLRRIHFTKPNRNRWHLRWNGIPDRNIDTPARADLPRSQRRWSHPVLEPYTNLAQ